LPPIAWTASERTESTVAASIEASGIAYRPA
jgi:hypothetical protein